MLHETVGWLLQHTWWKSPDFHPKRNSRNAEMRPSKMCTQSVEERVETGGISRDWWNPYPTGLMLISWQGEASKMMQVTIFLSSELINDIIYSSMSWGDILSSYTQNHVIQIKPSIKSKRRLTMSPLKITLQCIGLGSAIGFKQSI